MRAAYVSFLLRGSTAAGRGWGGRVTGRQGYQYVVLRCVPRADREEFLNVGVILYCEEIGFLGVRGARRRHPPRGVGAGGRAGRGALGAGRGARGLPGGSTVPSLARTDRSGGTALGTRFGFLSAPRSTVLRPGPIHGGTTTDPEAELARLLAVLVH